MKLDFICCGGLLLNRAPDWCLAALTSVEF